MNTCILWAGALSAFALTAACAQAQPREAVVDRLATPRGEEVILRSISHASMVLGWKNRSIIVDPVDGSAPYHGLARPSFILVTDIHGDHMDIATLTALDPAQIVAPQAVKDSLPSELQTRVIVLANGQSATLGGVRIEAVAMYNITEGRLQFHAKGRGNGYVLTFDDLRVYIAGDTEAIPEMKALERIDVAFVPMNLPYTMTPEQAAEGVKAFKPRIVYPYHYRGSDLGVFTRAVGADSEVRLREWYPGG
jgi:L-ascorbate metabolism protein UlaG (beta-lactamase superfamily)